MLILINNIKHYQNKYKFEILAYVIMPTHFHWIVMVNSKLGSISDIMRDIKKYSAWDIMGVIEKEDPAMVNYFREPAIKYKKQKIIVDA